MCNSIISRTVVDERNMLINDESAKLLVMSPTSMGRGIRRGD